MRPGPQPSPAFDAGLQRLLESRAPGQEYTQREIASACGVHHSRVQQIERTALRKLKGRLLAGQLGNECLGARLRGA